VTSVGVYVDKLNRWGWHLYGRAVQSCHLWADTLDELLDFASRVCLPSAWLQGVGKRGAVPHFDLTAVWRESAIHSGARELDARETVTSWKRWRKGGPCFQAGGGVYKEGREGERP